MSEPVVAVLAYHRVGPLPEGSWETWWHLPEDRFVEHLDLLVEQDWTPVDVSTFLRGLDEPSTLPPRTALVTFDDAYLTLAGCARAHMVDRGWPGVVFAPTAFIGGRNAWDDGTDEPSEAVCGWDELRALEASGISVEGHTVTHPRFSELGPDDVGRELEESKRLLEETLGKQVELFAYPYGDVGAPSARSSTPAIAPRSSSSTAPPSGRARPAGINCRACRSAPIRISRPSWLAAREGAGRRLALGAFGQLCGRQRGAVEDVVLADLDLVEPVAAHDLAEDRRSGDDHGRALGLEAGDAAPLLQG